MLLSALEGVFGGTAYVEGSRTAAVPTGVMMTPDTKVVVDFAFTDPSRRTEWLFGCRGALGASFVRGSMNVYCWILENDAVSGQSSGYPVDTGRHTAVLDGPGRSVTVLTGAYTNFTRTISTTYTKDGTVPLALFARSMDKAGKTFEYFTDARIYSCEIVSGGETTHLFVPCATGFKDVVTDAVKTCATTGTLTYVAGRGSADDYRREGGVLSCRVTAKTPGGGTVSAAETWAAKGSLLALAATPQAGWTFSHWKGDTWAIAEGVPTDASVQVRVDRALDLEAVFLPPTAGIRPGHYVQDGLVAQYDGIDNAGSGVHDATVRTWADLSGNGHDGTLATAITWADNGWQNNVNGAGVDIGTALGDTLVKRNYTLEFTLRPSRTFDRETLFGQYPNAGASEGLNIEHNSSSLKNGQVRLWFAASPDANADVILRANETASLTLAVSPTQQRLYRDGTLDYSRDGELTGTFKATHTTTLGGEPNRISQAFRGLYNAFRCYDHALTDDERTLNAALDAVRFRGVSASAVTLPGGYFFDADGTPSFRATVSALGAGALLVDGVAAEGGTCVDVVPLDGAVTHTFTAVPADGDEFLGWTGDVEAIVRGRDTDATITVTATRAIALAATFRTASAAPLPAAGNYVTDGLVLWYDGLENAGFGVHDGSAMTWKDLSGNNLDGAVASTVSWADDGWTNNSDGQPVKVTDTAIARLVASKNYTFEFACQPSRATSRESFASLYNGKNGLSIEHNSSSGQKKQLRLYFDNKPNYETTVTLDAGESATVALAVGSNAQEVYKNGALGFTGTTAVTGSFPDTSAFVVGGEPYRNTQAFRGKYRAFRAYNRKLTAGEALANALADEIRYVHPDATVWTRAAGGTWGDGTGWSAGIPNTTRTAYIPLSAPNVTVSVEGPVPPVENLIVGNGAGTSRVAIGAGQALEVRRGQLKLLQGARVQVDVGGRFVYDGASPEYDTSKTRIQLSDGGTLAVAGGTTEIRNLLGSMVLSGMDGRQGGIDISSGSLTVGPATDDCNFTIAEGGLLRMTGGSFRLAYPNHTTSYKTYLNGGAIDLSGAADCRLTGKSLQLKGGTLHLGGTARLVCETYPQSGDTVGRLLVGAWKKDGETVVTVDDDAAIELAGNPQNMIYLGNNVAGERSVVNWNSSTTFSGRDTFAVGFRKGYGELNVTRGRVQGGGYGLRIGQGSASYFTGDCPTGVVNVAGGCIATFSGWNSDRLFNGLVVGAGNCVDLSDPGFYRGTLNVSAGAVTNAGSALYFGVGIGYAEGDVNQTGGEIVHANANYQLVLGAWGGTARWTTAGGRALSKSDVYVGGILTNQTYQKTGGLHVCCPVTRHNATGLLAVSNGTFTIEKKLYAGEDGSATIVLGRGGVLTAASAQLKKTALKFVFDETGTGVFNVTGALALGADVTLEVDATAFTGANGTFPIVSCGSQSGDFASVTVRNGHGMVAERTATGWELRKASGTILVVR